MRVSMILTPLTVASLLAVVPTARAEAAPAEAKATRVSTSEKGPLVLASSACKTIFGGEGTRLKNEAFRRQRLHAVRSRQGKVELVHSMPKWEAPLQTRLPGVTVLGRTENGVKVVVDDSFGKACPQGEYELRIDDAIGTDSRVLAVLPQAVLLERGKKLVYLPIDHRRTARQFRMVWRSDFVWVPQQTKGSTKALTANASARTYPETKAATKEERKKRNEDARKRARERRDAAKRKSPQNVVDTLPTTQLAKELRGNKRSPRKAMKKNLK